MRRELGQIVDPELFLNCSHLVDALLKAFVAEHLVFVFLHPVAEFRHLLGL